MMSITRPQVDLTGEQHASLAKMSPAGRAAENAKKKLTSPMASVIAVLLAVVWTLPTFGLLISSFRPEVAIKTTGW
jgi:alpha-glucoside transport system permease protein